MAIYSSKPSGVEIVDIRDRDQVLKLVQDLVQLGDESRKPFEILAKRNERFYHGDQFTDPDPIFTPNDTSYLKFFPAVSQNFMRGITNTLTARILKQLPDVSFYPTSADQNSIDSARLAANFWDSFVKENQLDRTDDLIMKRGQQHGVGGYKIIFNPASDRVEWHPLSLFDFYLDPTKESFDDANWVIFRTTLDKWSAKQMLLDADVEYDPPLTTEEFGQGGWMKVIDDCVVVYELWHKPTARVPEGLFCKVVGQEVLDIESYPYILEDLETDEAQLDTTDIGPAANTKTGKRKRKTNNPKKVEPTDPGRAVLPIVYFKTDDYRGSPYGDTWFNDCTSIQRAINETEGAIARIRRKTSNVKLLNPNSDVVGKALLGGDQMVNIGPGQESRPSWLEPPVINPLLFQDRQFQVTRLFDLSGLNEVLAGASNVKSGTSAKQLAYLEELDAMKNRGTFQSFQTMKMRGAQLTLQLVKRWYYEQRILRVAGESPDFRGANGKPLKVYTSQAFSGADFHGITVTVEPRSGMERFHQAKVDEVDRKFQSGMIAAPTAAELETTGLDSTQLESFARKLIQSQCYQVIHSGKYSIDTSLDPAVAANEIQKVIMQLQSDGKTDDQLASLIAWHDAYLQQAQAPTDGTQNPQEEAAEQEPAPTDISQP